MTDENLNKLCDTYGEVILPKGTVLYHTSNNKFELNSDKPMLFLTFHPSDYIKRSDNYVTKIIFNRDVRLLFMIYKIDDNMCFISSLELIVKKTPFHNYRRHDKNLSLYINYLEEENFDGWYSPYHRYDLEVALINTPAAFSILSSVKCDWDWSRSQTINDTYYIPKNWGVNYTISTNVFPVRLNLNIRYKEMIDKYIEYGKNKNFNGSTLLIILNNCELAYHNSVISKIIWNFD